MTQGLYCSACNNGDHHDMTLSVLYDKMKVVASARLTGMGGLRTRRAHQPRLVKSRKLHRVQAAPDSEDDPRRFDEGAAQVKRLMERDRKEYAGPDFEKLMNTQFASDSADSETEAAPVLDRDDNPDAASVSPFGSIGGGAVNPFDPSQQPKTDVVFEMETPIEVEPWWSFIKNITLTQIFLVCSFLLITSSMLGTFFFVLNSGAIHFNE